MSKIPSLYHCKVCGLPLRPSDLNVVRLAVVWLKSKGTSIDRVVEEMHEYKHDFCNDKQLSEPFQPALF